MVSSPIIVKVNMLYSLTTSDASSHTTGRTLKSLVHAVNFLLLVV